MFFQRSETNIETVVDRGSTIETVAKVNEKAKSLKQNPDWPIFRYFTMKHSHSGSNIETVRLKFGKAGLQQNRCSFLNLTRPQVMEKSRNLDKFVASRRLDNTFLGRVHPVGIFVEDLACCKKTGLI